jgi:hypothetical protein
VEHTERLVRGGFPEAVARTDPRRRSRFLDNYVQNLIERDVRQLSEIERGTQLATMIRLLAARSATLVSAAPLASELGLARHRNSSSSILSSPRECLPPTRTRSAAEWRNLDNALTRQAAAAHPGGRTASSHSQRQMS